jgi:release factor glutamine methyltransferase
VRTTTLREALVHAEHELAAGPHPERARQDAEFLLCHVLGRNRAGLLAYPDAELDPAQSSIYAQMLRRRLDGEPMQHIVGEAEFYGLPFHLNRDVLIPRPETEHAVEKVLELAAQFAAPRIVDVGTGSGAIAVALAHKLPAAFITAIDLSPAALAVAKSNAARNGLANRIRFVEGDLLGPVAKEQFEIVVSNPPYVPEAVRESLSVEVRDYEPAEALFAGEDGLAIYRRLIPDAFRALVSGGFVVLEIGYGQQASVQSLLEDAGFTHIAFTADLQGIPRVASARRD